MTLVYCIVNGVLAISIDHVNVNTLSHEELHKLKLTIPCGIVDGCLFQIIFLGCVNTLFYEEFHHVNGCVLVTYQSCGKYQILLECICV